MIEEDETADGRDDNSLGRLLTLCDGVFAIAMTLLALDLKVPDLGHNPSEGQLRHALAENAGSYWSYLLTFYVVALYWIRHRKLMRSVVHDHPVLVRDTLALLLVVAAMPFAASLLGTYGGVPLSLAIYGVFNAAATLALIAMSRHIDRFRLADHDVTSDGDFGHSWGAWMNLGIFLLCIPAGFVFGGKGPLVLILLAVPNWITPVQRARARRAGRAA